LGGFAPFASIVELDIPTAIGSIIAAAMSDKYRRFMLRSSALMFYFDAKRL
jgi:hypothetical protein